MIKRTYSKFTKPDGKDAWGVTINQEGGEIISSFLFTDVSSFGEAIREEFVKVLAGEQAEAELTCNACHIRITPKKTRIVNMLSMESDEEAIVNVDSQELVELIDEWLAILHKQ